MCGDGDLIGGEWGLIGVKDHSGDIGVLVEGDGGLLGGVVAVLGVGGRG